MNLITAFNYYSLTCKFLQSHTPGQDVTFLSLSVRKCKRLLTAN